MVASVVPIQRLQYGPETAAGTLVPAVRMVDALQGTINFRRDMRTIVVKNAGSFGNAHRNRHGLRRDADLDIHSDRYDRRSEAVLLRDGRDELPIRLHLVRGDWQDA